MTDIEFINSDKVQEAINKLSNAIRAERNTTDSFLKIFADRKTLSRLDNNNNQIVYGRRGAGKSHLLLALGEHLLEKNTEVKKVIPIYIDLRKLLPLITESDSTKTETSVLIFQQVVNEILSVLTDKLR